MDTSLDATYDRLRDLLCSRYAATEQGKTLHIPILDEEIKYLCLVVAGVVIKNLCDNRHLRNPQPPAVDPLVS